VGDSGRVRPVAKLYVVTARLLAGCRRSFAGEGGITRGVRRYERNHMDISTFMKHLRMYRAPRVFNPWREYEPGLDISPEAPEIRYQNFQRYLELRRNAHYLFIAEGLSYQGGRFSGMAMTSERILLGHHPEVKPEEVLGEWDYRRTSNPESPLLKGTQKTMGFNEPTATVMWGSLHRHHLGTFDAVLWNIFPFHPHKEDGLLTNRTPDGNELNVGIVYAKELMELLPNAQVVAIGQKAAGTLQKFGVPCNCVPHPSMGGANKFKAAIAQLFGE